MFVGGIFLWSIPLLTSFPFPALFCNLFPLSCCFPFFSSFPQHFIIYGAIFEVSLSQQSVLAVLFFVSCPQEHTAPNTCLRTGVVIMPAMVCLSHGHHSHPLFPGRRKTCQCLYFGLELYGCCSCYCWGVSERGARLWQEWVPQRKWTSGTRRKMKAEEPPWPGPYHWHLPSVSLRGEQSHTQGQSKFSILYYCMKTVLLWGLGLELTKDT